MNQIIKKVDKMESEIKDLKAQAYDIFVQIQNYQMEVEKLKQQLIEINNRLQKAVEEENK